VDTRLVVVQVLARARKLGVAFLRDAILLGGQPPNGVWILRELHWGMASGRAAPLKATRRTALRVIVACRGWRRPSAALPRRAASHQQMPPASRRSRGAATCGLPRPAGRAASCRFRAQDAADGVGDTPPL